MSAPTVLKLATRKSQLALWQAEHVAALLRAAHPEIAVELLPMSTTGDRVVDRSLASIGGKGLFIKELESALSDLRADLAVHSMKDLPSELPPGLMIAAVLPRADPYDALVTARASGFAELPKGARLGTSSLRRQAQLLAARADLRIEPLRGNVDTRLSVSRVGRSTPSCWPVPACRASGSNHASPSGSIRKCRCPRSGRA